MVPRAPAKGEPMSRPSGRVAQFTPSVRPALAQVVAALERDLLLFVDVGGDVLAQGHEPGLRSPLCDAVMLAAADLLAEREVPVLGALFGTGCDGELTPTEVLERLAEVGVNQQNALA